MTLEATINTPISFVVSGPSETPLSDSALYIDGAASPDTFSAIQISTSNKWKVTFIPTSTGVYSFYAFGAVQTHIQCVSRSVQSFLANIEDEALGSWTWDKQSGVLTVLRQNGTVLATHSVVDTQSTASRERIS